LFPLPKCPDRPWGPRRLLFNGYRGSFLGVKGPGREVDWPSPNFSCKNELCYTFTPILCLYGLARETPAFIIIIIIIIILDATSLPVHICDNYFQMQCIK
jgi:hypothetical protein